MEDTENVLSTKELIVGVLDVVSTVFIYNCRSLVLS